MFLFFDRARSTQATTVVLVISALGDTCMGVRTSIHDLAIATAKVWSADIWFGSKWVTRGFDLKGCDTGRNPSRTGNTIDPPADLENRSQASITGLKR